MDANFLKSLPASKLSYLGELNESRENARTSGEAARACSQATEELSTVTVS